MLILTALAIIAVGVMIMLKNRTPKALDPKMDYDTRLYKFSLPTPKTKLGLPIGQNISFQFTDSKGKRIQR